ncbi:MAG: hypothetical protein AB7K14_09285 [Lysobacterales bacterium]
MNLATLHSVRRLAPVLLLALLLAACGGDPPPQAAEPAVASEDQEAANPRPDRSLAVVAVDSGSADIATPAGAIATIDKPVIETVAYEDLTYLVGEKIIIKTNLRTTRVGVLKHFLNTSLRIEAEERGRKFDIDIPRNTIAEVQVEWIHPQAPTAASPGKK